MNKLLIITFLFFSTLAHANMDFYLAGPSKHEIIAQSSKQELCPNSTTKDEINLIVSNLISEHFPSLIESFKDNRIKIREFENDSYFLKTFFKLGHILKEKRLYYLDINTKLYDCAPPKLALKAILAHELRHIADYKDSSSIQLIRLGLRMIGKKSRSRYERETDYHVMELGLSEGIREYRLWIYKRLSEKSLKKKKCFYYTPEEINRFLQGEVDFSDYFNKYCKKN